MTITIEAGKCYRTRDGRKVGPMRYADYLDKFTNGIMVWGRCGSLGFEMDHPSDLIAEWTDTPEQPGPVVTETIVQPPYIAPFGRDETLCIKPAKGGGYIVEVVIDRGLMPEQSAFTNAADLLVALQSAFGDKP